MSGTQIALVIVIIVIVVAAAAGAWALARRRALRQRFGPEYERVVSEQDSVRSAERELRERERKHAELELNELSPESCQRYAASWAQVQAQFVDEPTQAVGAAHQLVTELVRERGYPTEDHDEQLAHLSVEHARTLGHYRDAHEIYLSNERGEATTEQLRQALVHYRALFADLLGEDPVPPNGSVTDRTPQAPTQHGEALS